MSYDNNYNNSHKGLDNEKKQALVKVFSCVVLLFFIPFITVGIRLIVRGIKAMSDGSSDGFFLVFGCVWTLSVIAGIISIIGRIRFFLSETSPKKYDHGEDEDPAPFSGLFRSRHNGCKADHSDDDDNSLKGYE